MKIAKVECDFLVVEIKVPITEKTREYGMLLITLETDTGIKGYGVAREHDYHGLAVRQIILNDVAPFLMAQEEMTPQRFWHAATFGMFRDWIVPIGAVARAQSAIDVALWDLRGQELGEPVYKLLGGVQPEIDMYATFGLPSYTLDEMVEAARRLRSMGHKAFKLVGDDADGGRDISIDAERVKVLREALGDDAIIIIDGRNVYSLYQAVALAKKLAPYNLAFFDEPIWAKDQESMRRLRQAVPEVRVAMRGRGGSIFENRDMITSEAIDIMSSQVLDQGGYSQSIKVAHLAEIHQLPLVTGGGWYMHNAHLIGAVPNGWMTEYHVLAAPAYEIIFKDPIQPKNGKYRIGDRPGVGLVPNEDAVRDARKRARKAEESNARIHATLF